ADLVAIGVFALFLFGAMLYSVIQSIHKDRPITRVRDRVLALNPDYHIVSSSVADDAMPSAVIERMDEGSWLKRLHRQVMARLPAQPNGSKKLLVILAMAAAMAALVAFFIAHNVLGLMVVLQMALPPAAAVGTLLLIVPMLEERRIQKFSDEFPNAVDYVIRSVRAGIPVSEAIRMAGAEVPEPVGSELKRIGDALSVGMELKESLESAAARIAIPDFTFFTVCLIMQRETGGQLTATLENLSSIVRQRREIRLKTHAMTAEGRMSAKVLGSLPFFTAAALYLLNPGYIGLLFTNPLGNQILVIACALLLAGVVFINRLTQLSW
ncbi:MAG TPA: type II secretion system F family protein, partial [Patescibacteria group bacterium]|nr:type II secretion system F family protein [Patescibacteria group bacterium]